jgi:hypothetical protein
MTMKSDGQLRQDVRAELDWESSINAARIAVAVKDGMVTLSGHVDSYAEKFDAERAAQRVFGVAGLVVAIDVTPESPSQAASPRTGRSANRQPVSHAARQARAASLTTARSAADPPR